MEEYEDLGHINQINKDRTLLPSTSSSFQKFQQYNLTHLVFDGACSSSNRISLNDTLLVGPTIQEDMYSILL